MQLMSASLPNEEYCECGKLVRYFTRTPIDQASLARGFTPGWRQATDVLERPCPHHNGTVIEHCPDCDRRVGMRGVGVDSTGCECWN